MSDSSLTSQNSSHHFYWCCILFVNTRHSDLYLAVTWTTFLAVHNTTTYTSSTDVLIIPPTFTIISWVHCPITTVKSIITRRVSHHIPLCIKISLHYLIKTLGVISKCPYPYEDKRECRCRNKSNTCNLMTWTLNFPSSGNPQPPVFSHVHSLINSFLCLLFPLLTPTLFHLHIIPFTLGPIYNLPASIPLFLLCLKSILINLHLILPAINWN